MLASLMGHAPLLQILLDAGADPSIKDNRGLTAFEWAQRRGNQKIIALLWGLEPTSRLTSERRSEQPSDPSARRDSVVEGTSHHLNPQQLGPASMAVLKTVHASLEAERQKAGLATQMVPESTSVNPPQAQESVASREPINSNERERLFSAGFKKLEAQIRGNTDGSAGPIEEPEVGSDSVGETTLVEKAFADPLLTTRELATAPLISSPSPSPTDDGSNEAAASDEDRTAWSTPLIETEPQPADEETVLAAEPVVAASEEPPAAPKTSFLHNSIFDARQEPATTAPSVIRPVLWVLILFALIGTVYLTYVLTNRFMNRGGAAASNNLASTTSPATSAPPGTPVKVPSKFPMTAGALADAESNLPDAEYPAKAKSDGISGIVTVVVRVNRGNGGVVSARALNGERQLRAAAEKAAKQAKFSPTKLGDEDKVVSGTITYRFGNATVPNTEVTDAELPVLGGALAGTGVNVPKAEYPQDAKSSGSVLVVARVNRFGDVIAAHALNGNSRLRTAAVNAARKAKFSREKLPTETLVTSGTITYYFKPAALAPAAVAPAGPAAAPTPTQVTAEAPTRANADIPIVGGDLAGKEKNIPKAEYPAEARRKGISGMVTILVRVNKNGHVISWKTLNGDNALRSAALTAARKATFEPEKLGKIDTVLGTITYNFQP